MRAWHYAICKAIFDRIIAKVKSKKLSLLAVCNILMKQDFVISQWNIKYDVNQSSMLPA